jgi:hypothetical protein
MDTPVSFPESWTPPRELSRALPREIHMSARAIFMAVVAALLLAAAVPMFLLVQNEGAQRAARIESLRAQGREAQGEITRLWREGNSSTPMVAYAFSADGRRFQGKSSVPARLWDGLQKGGFLPVRFLPSDPKINHPLAWEESPQPPWVPFLFPAWLVGWGIVLAAKLRLQAAVVAEGLPTAGIVTGCHRTKGGWTVRYRFRTKDGAMAKGSTQTRKMETGATVCVLYLPQNPRRNLMYPACLYRVEV